MHKAPSWDPSCRRERLIPPRNAIPVLCAAGRGLVHVSGAWAGCQPDWPGPWTAAALFVRQRAFRGSSLPGVPTESSDASANLRMLWHRLALAPGSANRGEEIADRIRSCFGLPDPGTKPVPCFFAHKKGPLEREPCELMNVAVEGSNSFHGGRQGTPRDRT